MLYQAFPEDAVFRVDHFLMMQTVQNILGLRFANRVFETLWNRDHIERIEIVWDETLTLEGRASYYDRAGALRDMVQNHLLQPLCLTLHVDNWRWAGVPFVLRTGKALARDRREIVIRFRGVPHLACEEPTLGPTSCGCASTPTVWRSGSTSTATASPFDLEHVDLETELAPQDLDYHLKGSTARLLRQRQQRLIERLGKLQVPGFPRRCSGK